MQLTGFNHCPVGSFGQVQQRLYNADLLFHYQFYHAELRRAVLTMDLLRSSLQVGLGLCKKPVRNTFSLFPRLCSALSACVDSK